jgi:hypothetical protein
VTWPALVGEPQATSGLRLHFHSMIQAQADELELVANQVRLHPPDDVVTLEDVGGSLYAHWTSGGEKVSVGPSVTKQRPD